MFIITLTNGTVLAKTSSISVSEKGQVINDDAHIAYGFKVNTYEIPEEDFPADFVPYKYLYLPDTGFAIDSNYSEPDEQPNLEEKLLAAEAKIAELEDALCELSMIVEEVLG